MCCLRYEFEAYKDFKSRAPKKKAIIDTPLGKARVQEYNTPREELILRLESGKVFPREPGGHDMLGLLQEEVRGIRLLFLPVRIA